MGTEILKSFGSLQSELEQAKSSLKGVDENIKRLIGRDPSELPPRPAAKRGTVVTEEKGRSVRGARGRNFAHENEAPPNKRRNTSGVSVFQRLSERERPVHHEDIHHGVQKQMISKVIVTPKEVPSRQEALAAQSKDEKSKARNRRMFGALLGTLQKFQQEETKLKQKEDKRAQLEKKIEEHEIKEKEEIKKEKQELFLNRRKKQSEIRIIELKMVRMKEYAAWEERQKPRTNFILTKTKPQIQYLPRRLNEANKAALETSKTEIENLIEKRRQDVFSELKHIEERMKRNFENRFLSKELKEPVIDKEGELHEDDHDNHMEFDIDGDAIMTELPPEKDDRSVVQELDNSVVMNASASEDTNTVDIPIEKTCSDSETTEKNVEVDVSTNTVEVNAQEGDENAVVDNCVENNGHVDESV